ncbi:MAG TPA: HypC/HybG/HupF family hydrogenase formation chaperone [Bacteroidales bacterium]|jgi:hydrogenase expression/formation protein HypC|nr:HypC/HybG/HupF family hydrogenase formation chaperone [Bacteroidales bacterium]MDX9905872.1 HypC/HybG/HupF family hydrogenase formation chaperone [Bacteroidales bacterium]HNQ83080.1 HypC/HybG/HupF family hydrogenase formation chaperone [Bacteroidales bacterium]HOX76960.1 HypC/HybG/HupF family hydrogenase formation chaperone [Bacteroidales bacterium]HPI85812.1 HypC/HybG/HupF family hydrogenase formation chaperone [Bacteroidales bacterium]
MCLAVPGKLISIETDTPLKMGKVDFDGVVTDICLEFLPEANVGDYVLAHVGTAISLLDEEEAMETLRALRELGEIKPDYELQ